MNIVKNVNPRNKLETQIAKTEDLSNYASPSRIKSREADIKALRDAIAELKGDQSIQSKKDTTSDRTSNQSHPSTLGPESKEPSPKEPLRVFLDKVMKVEQSLRNYLFKIGQEISQISEYLINDIRRIIK